MPVASLLLFFASLLAAACGSTKPEVRPVEIPARRATSGDRILAFAPSGADAVLEIDLARLRANSAVGPLLSALQPSGIARPDLFSAASLLVICSYRVGESDAGQIVFAAGAEVERLPGARVLEEDLVALGPPALLDRVDLVRAGAAPPLRADRALLRVRALAMPERAPGASVRMAARFGFDGRIALARRLELEIVPAWLSLWADVADDLAAVALLGGDGAGDAHELARAAIRLRERVAASAPARRLGLGRIAAQSDVDVKGDEVRVALVVGPRRLGRLVALVLTRLRAPEPDGKEEKEP